MARIAEKSKYIIVGAVAGGVLFFGVYFLSMYTLLTVETAVRTLVFPTLFGLAGGGLVGHELYSRRVKARQRKAGAERETRMEMQKIEEVEQNSTDNVKGEE